MDFVLILGVHHDLQQKKKSKSSSFFIQCYFDRILVLLHEVVDIS